MRRVRTKYKKYRRPFRDTARIFQLNTLSNIEEALLKFYGFKDLRDWDLEDGQLVKYEDVSWHGSCAWKEVDRMTNADVVELYIQLNKIIKYLDKIRKRIFDKKERNSI